MSAAELIHRARVAGVEMAVREDGRLQLRADRPPSADLQAELAAHKDAIIATLRAVNDPQQPRAWLHLLTLSNGGVIQHCGDTDTAAVEQTARILHGDSLQDVVPVPGFERPLSEGEIVKALAGTLATPAPAPVPSNSGVWLARVARLLGTRPSELLEGGHLEPHDLVELAGTDAALVADTIRTSPAWINRPQRAERKVEAIIGAEVRPQHIVHTAATASSEWVDARDQYHAHIFGCRVCYAPTGRFCAMGAELRLRYDSTPMETTR